MYKRGNTKRCKKVLTGDVQLFHDSSFYLWFCGIDGMIVSAYKMWSSGATIPFRFCWFFKYNGSTKTCDLFGEVIPVSGGQTLTTKKIALWSEYRYCFLPYRRDFAIQFDGIKKARKDIYHVKKTWFILQVRVQMTDPEIQLRTDSLEFDTKTHTAIFVAPTLMEKMIVQDLLWRRTYGCVQTKTVEF